jgi:hypothetical protein
MGPIGRRRHFNWKEIASIHDGDNLLKSPVEVLRHLLSLRLNRGICLDGRRPKFIPRSLPQG